MKKTQEEQQRRVEFLKRLENAFNKNNLTEFDKLLSEYHLKFDDSVEETKALVEACPQFPLMKEHFYDTLLDDEKDFAEYVDEYDKSENSIEKEHEKDRLIEEEKLLRLAEKTGDDNFIPAYFDLMNGYGISNDMFEKLGKSKDKIISVLIGEIKKLITVRHDDREVRDRINFALTGVGKIRCEESVVFLNKLLDDYMKELQKYYHDDERNQYINFEFFQILDCMVKQQNKRSVPHIYKARNFFPKGFVDYTVCNIAAGRIEKGISKGYLPMEAVEIAFPEGAAFNGDI